MIVISKEYYSNLYHNHLTVIAAHKLHEDIPIGHVVVIRWRKTREELHIPFFIMQRACVNFCGNKYLWSGFKKDVL